MARALADLPHLSEAMRTARISYSKVRALTRIATPENEKELLDVAQTITASHVENLVRAWRGVDRAVEAEEDELRHQSRYLSYYTDENGMLVLSARLEPETGAAVVRAIEAATDRLYRKTRETKKAAEENENPEEQEAKDGSAEPLFPAREPSDSIVAGASVSPETQIAAPSEEPSSEQIRADALGIVAESALANDLDPGTRGDRYQVVVHVDAEALADPDQPGQSALKDGAHISAETSRRLACDCSRIVMISGSNGANGPNGSSIDVGRKNPHDPTRITQSPHPPRPHLPFSGLQQHPVRRPSRRALGRGWQNRHRQPRLAVQNPSPSRARGRLPRRASLQRYRHRCPLLPTHWAVPTRGAGPARVRARSPGEPAELAPGGRARDHLADGTRVGGRGSRLAVGDRVSVEVAEQTRQEPGTWKSTNERRSSRHFHGTDFAGASAPPTRQSSPGRWVRGFGNVDPRVLARVMTRSRSATPHRASNGVDFANPRHEWVKQYRLASDAWAASRRSAGSRRKPSCRDHRASWRSAPCRPDLAHADHG